MEQLTCEQQEEVKMFLRMRKELGAFGTLSITVRDDRILDFVTERRERMRYPVAEPTTP